jgi:hypothetical protein
VTRILIDQGLAPLAARIVCERGFDAVYVAEIGMERAEDPTSWNSPETSYEYA